MEYGRKNGHTSSVYAQYASNLNGPPKSYEDSEDSYSKTEKWKPRNWSKRLRIGVIVGAVLLIAIIIIAAVLGARANSYPDYSALNYTLQDTYTGPGFFDNFDYFEGYDPAGGFVHYVPRETAMLDEYNLTYAGANSAVVRVDTSQTNASTGRYSVRLTSKKQYNSGLFIFDVLNTPYGCSTWPALWLTDPANWPEHGRKMFTC